MPTPFSLTETPADDGVVRLAGTGELDMSAAPLLEGLVAGVVRRTHAKHLLIDLGEVTFLDAAGLSALSACRRDAHAYGTEVRISAARGIVRRVLDITGMWEWLSDQPGRGRCLHV